MFKINRFICVFLILFFFFISNADAAKRYKYVCDSEICYNTEIDYILDNYYISNTDSDFINKKIDNFTNVIDSKLQDYIDYYGNDTILINNFCEGNCEKNRNLDDREFTIEELIDYDDSFHIGDWVFFGIPPDIEETFDNGYDFLFTYFGDIIDELHSNGYPFGDKNNKLSDLVGNIVNYSDLNNNFELRNVCDSRRCNKSQEKTLIYGDSDVYYFISGNIKQSTQFIGDTFKVSDEYNIFESGSIDSNATLIKGGETIDFVFSFEDYLDFTEDITEYKYIISYNNEGDPISTHIQELTETITIDNSTFEVTSDGLGENLESVIDIEVLEPDSRKIKVSINESFNIPKAGNKYFYLQADNLTSGDSFPITKINTIPLEVIADDNIIDSIGLINNFSLESNELGFGEEYPFQVTMNLLDSNFNQHFDQISGYTISLSAGNSEYFEISSDGLPESIWGKSIESITTNINNQVVFYFRITKPGYHNFKGFDFKVREKNDSSNYSTPEKYFELNNQIPNNLLVDGEVININIKTPIYSELPITCSQNVKINFICTSDDLSGCYSNDDTYYDFNNESDNGTEINLSIRDNAYNWRNYSGVLNHVDKTGPSIEIYKGIIQLDPLVKYNYLANSEDLVLKFNETTTSNCRDNIYYDLNINNEDYLEGSLDFNNQALSIPRFFEGALENKKLDIKITDSYGNFNTLSITFNIYPEYWTSNLNVSKIEPSGSKFANNYDEYIYTFAMKDKYGNSIYGKEIELVEQSNDGTTGDFYSLKLNENNNDDIDFGSSNTPLSTALTTEFTGTSSLDGSHLFKLKSYTPGKFTEKFNVKIKKWKNDYTDYNNDFQIVNIGNIGNVNLFKKPIIGELSLLGTDNPALNTNYKFDITLINTGGLNNISNGQLILNKDSVINKTEGHRWEDNSFKIIGSNSFSFSDMDLSFSGTVDAIDNYTEAIQVGFNDLKIIYILGGKLISYFLDDSDLDGGCDVETLGLKVYGTLEGEGKSSDVGQDENFSDLSKLPLRGEIRKKAFILSKFRNSDYSDNINGIIYVEGDVTYSQVKDYLNYNDTIIIKDGNFIIDEDVNTNIGIIVLKNNYDVLSDFNKSGNIYVNKDVNIINAIIYSDGAFRSANSSGELYSDYELNTKLEFNGSLFTRNTIGGSVGQNTLPGGKLITLPGDFYIANIYDLNNVRKQILDCSGDNSDNYSFIIRYNSSIQTNPPKGFDIK